MATRPLPQSVDPGGLGLTPQVRPHPIRTPRSILLLAATKQPGTNRTPESSARDALLRQFFGGLSA